MRIDFLVSIVVFGLLGVACGGASSTAGGTSGETDSIKTVVLGGTSGVGSPAPAMPGVNVPAIKVNTVGYPADWRKVAVFNVEPSGVKVVSTNGGKTFDIGADKVAEKGVDEASKDPTWQVDLSSIRAPGTYKVVQGDMESDPFTVGGAVYDEALLAGIKSFYFQRTRTALVEPYATWKGNSYTRKGISHAHDDVGWDLMSYPEKKNKWKMVAGWHDAGNYDMYIPSTAPSAQALLMAYEWNPSLFDDKSLNIPESGNGIPDILDEVKWGLDWILSMQEEGGAFRHREAVMGFSPEVPADEDKEVRWVAGVSTSATAKAVAVLAMASDVYKEWDAAYAKRCGESAKRGWAFLLANKEHIRADGKGSKQPLWDDEPVFTDVGARFIAATEMWVRFRNKDALSVVESLMDAKETADVTEFMKGAWANLSRWGLATLALDEESPEKLRKEAQKRILEGAELQVAQAHGKDGYLCASKPIDYYWAHNSNLMEKTHILAVAEKLAPGKNYLEAARDQWHWVLGRNPNGYSMITGVGKGPERMYHMEWGGHEPPPPGFLLGGPNADNMGFLAPGAPAKALLWDNPKPLRSGLEPGSLWHWRQSDLWDGDFVGEGEWTEGWWAVSEPDILYSANFVLVAVAIR